MRSTVDHQARTARTKRSATRPKRARAAARAGASPRSCVDAITTSGGPGELGCREARPALEFDAEGIDPCMRRLRDGEVRPGGMVDASDTRRRSGLDAEGHDILDLEIDRVADLHAVPKPILADLDRRSLDDEVLADERRETLQRATELDGEDDDEPLRLLLRGVLVDEDAELPVPVGHHLRG